MMRKFLSYVLALAVFFAVLLRPPALVAQAAVHTSVPSTYVLGPEDEITIKSLDAEELSGTPYRIDSSGNVRLPLMGTLHCAGLTIEQLERELAKRLKVYVKDPQVSIRVAELRSRPVSVFGAVKKPGVQQLQAETTLVELLSAAGGLAEDSGNFVRITRRLEWGPIPLPGAADDPTGKYSTAQVSVKTIMGARNPESNIIVRPNDVVTVPRADMVYVIGEVKKAGGFTMRESEKVSVLQALSFAEGMSHSASAKNAKILRLTAASSNREEISVNLQNILAGKQTDVIMLPDDILFVPNNAPKSAALRGVEAAIQIGTGVAVFHR